MFFVLCSFLLIEGISNANPTEKDIWKEIEKLSDSNQQLKKEMLELQKNLDEEHRNNIQLIQRTQSLKLELKEVREEKAREVSALKKQIVTTQKTFEMEIKDLKLICEQNMKDANASEEKHTIDDADFLNRLKENDKSQTGTANNYAVNPAVEHDSEEYVAFKQNTETKRQVSGGIQSGSRVAFSVTLTNDTTGLHHDDTVIFDNALLNLGNAYLNGTFVAPVPGIYVFHATLDATIKTDAKIVKKGQTLATFECEPWDPSTQTVIVELQTGEDVSVKIQGHNNVAIYGHGFSTFSGFLLHDFTDPEIIDETKRQLAVRSQGGSLVAFSATLMQSVSGLQAEQDVVFDHALLNLGNAYLVYHGVFVAPTTGIYVFHTTLDATIKTDAKIVKKGQTLATFECEPWNPSSQTVIVELQAGDDVSVKILGHHNVALFGNGFSTFSGFLLYDYTSPSAIVGK